MGTKKLNVCLQWTVVTVPLFLTLNINGSGTCLKDMKLLRVIRDPAVPQAVESDRLTTATATHCGHFTVVLHTVKFRP